MLTSPRVNVENIERLIARIEADPTFTMRAYVHPCGSPACIAGTAWAMDGMRSPNPLSALGRLVGVGEEDAYRMAVAYGADRQLRTKPQAIAMLRNLQVTGRVEWPTAMERT